MGKVNFKKRKENRLVATIIFFSIVMIAYVIRLGYIQIIEREAYSYSAIRNQYKDFEIPPKRGNIYDRNGKELAVSVTNYNVWVEVIYAQEKGKAWDIAQWEEASKKIAPILGASEEHVFSIIKKNLEEGKARFELTKRLDHQKMVQLKELGYKAIYFEEEKNRLYPYGQFASYILGHISQDNSGLGGLEYYFNKELTGIPGRKIALSDAQSHEIEAESYQYYPVVNGYHLISTVDEVIQHYVEKAMEQSYLENNSKRSMAIVLDPKTGDILAMASKPDYNPAEPRETYYQEFRAAMEEAETSEEQTKVLDAMWRNPFVNDLYEPGSVFKTVTASAGIEEGVVAPNSVFHDAGSVMVADRPIKNWTDTPFGTIDFKKAVGQSVNTVFVEVARRLGSTRFLEYISAFGFGKKTGISLPGEQRGIVYSLSKMGPVEQATTAFGQGISVTPIQMAMAVGAIANDGMLMKPRLIKEIVDDNGEIIERFEPQVVKKVISKNSDKIMLSLMENVVEKEGGKLAKIEGYRVAGKSGTAQKVIDKKYKKGYYISSFVGIAPVEDPKVVVLVVTDEPRGAAGIYGGTNSAPYVKMILENTLRYMGVTPNAVVSNNTNIEKHEVPEIRNLTFKEARVLLEKENLKYTTEVEAPSDNTIVADVFPKPGEKIPVGSSVVIYFEGTVLNEVLMPDLKGKTVGEVEKIVTSLGLRLSFSGSGKAVKQFPEANKLVKKNSMVNVKFEDPSAQNMPEEDGTQEGSQTEGERSQESTSSEPVEGED